MNQQVRQITLELKKKLSEIYGEPLKGIYLFGSHARGEADEESDVDVLILLDEVPDYSKEIERTSVWIADLSLRYGLTISRVFATEQRWRKDQTMFFLNVREEAVLA